MQIKISGILTCLTLLTASLSAVAQEEALTYHKDIEPIIIKNCVPCHRQGQAAPFPLTSFQDVIKRADFIKHAVETRYMPPWFADPEFRSFKNERILNQEDIDKISAWVAQGKKRGTPVDRPALDNLAESYPEPDLVVPMNKPFTIPGDNQEHFRVFVMPTDLEKEVYVKGIDYLPGNRRYTHHSRMMIDTTNTIREDDGIEIGEESVFENSTITLYDYFYHGWVPGNFPVMYPEGIAKKLPAGSDLVMNVHYSPTPVDETDNARVAFYLSDEKPERFAKTYILKESDITNGPLIIPAGSKQTFYMRSPVIRKDISLINLLPHMHLLGKSFRAFAITPDSEVIPLLKIDDWDFNWQMTYQFHKMLRIPKGSVIYAEATFDNTEENPRNPSYPPVDVGYGWGTKDEMFELIMQYVPYQEGDEDIEL
ncbi:hypothetical protein AB9P05_10100 [Roseivirga sp. BDSF3-8]|uniref:monooxygenase n=1 Tax=Roseivirga sp. BDSF3-8 TaxID=3241598 RepID=UPI003531C5A6